MTTHPNGPSSARAEAVSQTTRWTTTDLNRIGLKQTCVAPVIRADQVAPVLPEIWVWDAWPVLRRDGGAVDPDLWMALASPRFANPDERHAHARIRLLERTGQGWRDFGPAMPDGFSPGSREWSGSAVLDADGRMLTLYFTAAGRRDEPETSFEQRLFEARGTLRCADRRCWLDWSGLAESFGRDPVYYMDPQAGSGSVGTIKAFRDPSYFRDPASGRSFIFFTASLAGSSSAFNGTIGVAAAAGPGATHWRVQPPVISAEGLNNELERPHVIWREGRYYLFWSTQTHVFNPAGTVGPTGLYGMVSDNLMSGWEPLNGSGLVIANPPEAPRQAYSWYVLPDLSVTSFVDAWGVPPRERATMRFGGTFAPFLRLEVNGANTRLQSEN